MWAEDGGLPAFYGFMNTCRVTRVPTRTLCQVLEIPAARLGSWLGGKGSPNQVRSDDRIGHAGHWSILRGSLVVGLYTAARDILGPGWRYRFITVLGDTPAGQVFATSLILHGLINAPGGGDAVWWTWSAYDRAVMPRMSIGQHPARPPRWKREDGSESESLAGISVNLSAACAQAFAKIMQKLDPETLVVLTELIKTLAPIAKAQ